MGFKLNNHPNKSNSGLTFSEQKQNETLRKQQESIQRLKDRKNQPGLFENLDNVQTTLEGVGMTAGPQSIAADIANTAVSLGRGVYSFGKGDTESGKEHITMAGLHGLSSIPLLGKIAEGFKLGRRAKNVAKNINKTETPTHFKSTREATTPVRGGETIDDPVGEFNNLVSMNKIAPKNFVKPIGMKTDEAGNIIGTAMSKVKGKTLMEIHREGGNFTKKMANEINTAIKKINQKGYFHGDIQPNNIIIKPNGIPVIIDPVGAGHLTNMSENLAEDLMKRDKTAVSNIIEFFKR